MNKDIEKAVQFYVILITALRTPGIDKIVVTMDKDGELEANVMEDK